MMHPNFYHWHTHAEFKPDPAILEARWNAATKFAEKPSAADICSLVRLVAFPGAEPEFAKRFSDALLKLEPTFPPEGNGELLRVMATAAIYNLMDQASIAADAAALGLHAAAFPEGRVEPVCAEVMTRAMEYLAAESERMRPVLYAAAIETAEKQAETQFTALKKAVEGNAPQEIGKATEAVGRAMLAAIKKSHQQLGEVVGRMAEESQFLWWLVNRRSSTLDKPRGGISAQGYALVAAAEAAERVILLPPAASVEAIISEVLSQCVQNERANALVDYITAADSAWRDSRGSTVLAPDLTPITAFLAKVRADKKLDGDVLKQLRISPKLKIAPAEAAHQYFRELMFIRALATVG